MAARHLVVHGVLIWQGEHVVPFRGEILDVANKPGTIVLASKENKRSRE